jgi:hypothetical protein
LATLTISLALCAHAQTHTHTHTHVRTCACAITLTCSHTHALQACTRAYLHTRACVITNRVCLLPRHTCPQNCHHAWHPGLCLATSGGGANRLALWHLYRESLQWTRRAYICKCVCQIPLTGFKLLFVARAYKQSASVRPASMPPKALVVHAPRIGLKRQERCLTPCCRCPSLGKHNACKTGKRALLARGMRNMFISPRTISRPPDSISQASHGAQGMPVHGLFECGLGEPVQATRTGGMSDGHAARYATRGAGRARPEQGGGQSSPECTLSSFCLFSITTLL